MTGHVKLYETILDSSLWEEPATTRIVFITLLAKARPPHGRAEVSTASLARIANVTREEAEEALRVLASPDPESKSKDHDGRRIKVGEGGIFVLNHDRYRRGDPNSSGAQRTRNYRENQDLHLSASRDVTNCHPASASASEIKNKKVPCPPDLKLTDAQAANSEMAGVPKWAQESITRDFVGKYLADDDDLRTLVAWRKCLSRAVNGIWSDPAKRPRQPEPERDPQAARAAEAAREAEQEREDEAHRQALREKATENGSGPANVKDLVKGIG